jgi:hypothetical protein
MELAPKIWLLCCGTLGVHGSVHHFWQGHFATWKLEIDLKIGAVEQALDLMI